MEVSDSTPRASSPKHKAAKRQKVTRACDSCKARKRRCTGELPCPSCSGNSIECTYNASYTRGRVVQPIAASLPTAPNLFTTQNSTEFSRDHATARLENPNAGQSLGEKVSRGGSPEGEPATLAGQYSGPSSAYSFLRRAWRRFGLDSTQQEGQEPHRPVSIFS